MIDAGLGKITACGNERVNSSLEELIKKYFFEYKDYSDIKIPPNK